MSTDSEFQEKIDTLDLIINVLKEHEKILDKLAEKLESTVNNLKTRGAEGEKIRKSISLIDEKISSLNDAIAQFLASKTPKPARFSLVQCEEWTDFKDKSRGARRVAFEAEEKAFTVNSMSDEEIYEYSEALAEHEFCVKEEEKRYVLEKMFIDSLDDVPLVFKRGLKCGLDVSIISSKFDLPDGRHVFKLTYHVDPERAKRWLSKELEVPEDNIIEGKIIF